MSGWSSHAASAVQPCLRAVALPANQTRRRHPGRRRACLNPMQHQPPRKRSQRPPPWNSNPRQTGPAGTPQAKRVSAWHRKRPRAWRSRKQLSSSARAARPSQRPAPRARLERNPPFTAARRPTSRRPNPRLATPNRERCSRPWSSSTPSGIASPLPVAAMTPAERSNRCAARQKKSASSWCRKTRVNGAERHKHGSIKPHGTSPRVARSATERRRDVLAQISTFAQSAGERPVSLDAKRLGGQGARIGIDTVMQPKSDAAGASRPALGHGSGAAEARTCYPCESQCFRKYPSAR